MKRIAVAVLVLVWAGACSESAGPDPTVDSDLSGPVISDPVLAAVTRAAPISAASEDEGAWIFASLGLGTASNGAVASVTSSSGGFPVWTTIREGGFDPVAVFAAVDDNMQIDVRNAMGASVYAASIPVRGSRRPKVVRTFPPPRKRDVPLNSSVVIVFSEPIDPATISSTTVRLQSRGGSVITGDARVLPGGGTSVAFTPAAPLARNTDYLVSVTQGVTDLEGEALETAVAASFRTGQATVGPPAFVDVNPDTVYVAGATYQMSLTVQDAAGNMLIDQPVTWLSSDPNGLTVSTTGLVTPVVVGSYVVTATVNGVTGIGWVFVVPGNPDSVTVAPSTATVGASGDTIKLRATVRDALGRVLPSPVVTWISGDTTLAVVALDSVRSGGSFATVTGVRVGAVTITAASGPAHGTAAITVAAASPSASVTVTPETGTLVAGEELRVTATVRDASGKILGGRAIAWSTDNPSVANVDGNGVITASSIGAANIIATSQAVSDTVRITVTAFSVPVMTSTLAAGLSHSCTLVSGAAYCWGENRHNQLGDGTNLSSATPVPVAGGLSFITITAGAVHTCGLTSGGAAYCWGENELGQLGDGTQSSRSTPVAVAGGHTFNAIATGSRHTCGLTNEGAVYCWGYNRHGQLGTGSVGAEVPIPAPAAVGYRFVAITAGSGITDEYYRGAYAEDQAQTCALTRTGRAYCWGGNERRQVSDSNVFESAVPLLVTDTLAFVSLRAGSYHTCALTAQGKTYCWGRSAWIAEVTSPSFAVIGAGGGHDCGLTSGGTAHCWGGNSFGELGDGSRTPHSAATPVAGNLQFAAIAVGIHHTCAQVVADQSVYCWGNNTVAQLGDGQAWWTPAPVAGGLTFTAIALGYAHACGQLMSGETYCWGLGFSGQVGDGTNTNRAAPVLAFGSVPGSSLAAGSIHSCATTSTNAVYCWGDSYSRHLVSSNTCADGATSAVGIAVLITCFPTAQETYLRGLVGGDQNTCGISADSAAYCWGFNYRGELGIGTTTARSWPSPVAGNLRFKSLAAGSVHNCGLTGPGAAYCWGYNGPGSLGNGLTTNSSTPVAVTGGLTFAALTAGDGQTCGLTSGGVAYCWGDNTYGQLGDGSLTSRLAPVPVSGALTFSSLRAGDQFTCGLTSDGTTYCWGWDQSGQLGDAQLTGRRSAPFAVPGAPPFSVLEAGGAYACGLTAAGVAYCWGDNGYGQLGRGMFAHSTVPVKVAGLP